MLRFPTTSQTASAIDVGSLQRKCRAGRHRVIASVDGRPVWLDSPEHPVGGRVGSPIRLLAGLAFVLEEHGA